MEHNRHLKSHQRIKRQRLGVPTTGDPTTTPAETTKGPSTTPTPKAANPKTTPATTESDPTTKKAATKTTDSNTQTSSSKTKKGNSSSSTTGSVTGTTGLSGTVTGTSSTSTGTAIGAGSNNGTSSGGGISTGAIVGIIAVVAVVAVAGLFFFVRKKKRANVAAANGGPIGSNKRASAMGAEPLRSDENLFSSVEEKNGGGGWGGNGGGYGAVGATRGMGGGMGVNGPSNEGRVWGEEKINVVPSPSATNFNVGAAPPPMSSYPPSYPPSNGYQSPPPQFDDYNQPPMSAQPLMAPAPLPIPANVAPLRQYTPSPTLSQNNMMSPPASTAHFSTASSQVPLLPQGGTPMTPGSDFFGPNRSDTATPKSNVPVALLAGAGSPPPGHLPNPLMASPPQPAQPLVAPPAPVPAPAPEHAENPFPDSPEQGKVFSVVRTFEPNMNDELVIYPGDKVQILMNYDDGWVLGVNLSINPPQRGVFPRDCVEEADPSSPLPGATNGNNENKGNTLMGNNHFTIMEEDEDEPSELPYGPPSPKNKVADKAPFLPPIDFVTSSASPPTIAVEAPAEHNSNHIAGPGVGGVTPSQSSGNVSTASGKNVRRSSSLIASRDAELFVALGEALDDGKKRQQTNMI